MKIIKFTKSLNFDILKKSLNFVLELVAIKVEKGKFSGKLPGKFSGKFWNVKIFPIFVQIYRKMSKNSIIFANNFKISRQIFPKFPGKFSLRTILKISREIFIFNSRWCVWSDCSLGWCLFLLLVVIAALLLTPCSSIHLCKRRLSTRSLFTSSEFAIL